MVKGTINVMELGARGDGSGNDGGIVQEAIDRCSGEGGGTVYLPPGKYLSGPVTLRTGVSLRLEGGAVLMASRDPTDYPHRPVFMSAEGEERITICGRGTIDGQVREDLGRRPGHEGERRPAFRTRLVRFDECQDVTVRGVTLRYSDAWTLHLWRCQNVVVDGITVLNNYFRTNTDGINPDSCRDVHISNCHLVCGDDCICIKTHNGHPCENVVVSNCTLESIATAIKIGTESSGDFRNILISNCVVRNSTVGLGIYVKDGGTVAGVTCTNMAVETLTDSRSVNKPRLGNATFPVFIDIEKRTSSSPAGAVRDVILRGITINSDNGILVQGMGESKIENLTLGDISFRVTGVFSYEDRRKHAGGRGNPEDDRIEVYARRPSYVTLANVDGLVVDNLRVYLPEKVFEENQRSALHLEKVQNSMLSGIFRRPLAGRDRYPALKLVNCRNLILTDKNDGGNFVSVEGRESSDIRLFLTVEGIDVDPGVPGGAVNWNP